MRLPDDLARVRIEGLRDGVAHAQVWSKDHEPRCCRVAVDDNIVKQMRCFHVYVERLNLEDNLDDAVDDGEGEVEESDLRERHAVNLVKSIGLFQKLSDLEKYSRIVGPWKEGGHVSRNAFHACSKCEMTWNKRHFSTSGIE